MTGRKPSTPNKRGQSQLARSAAITRVRHGAGGLLRQKDSRSRRAAAIERGRELAEPIHAALRYLSDKIASARSDAEYATWFTRRDDLYALLGANPRKVADVARRLSATKEYLWPESRERSIQLATLHAARFFKTGNEGEKAAAISQLVKLGATSEHAAELFDDDDVIAWRYGSATNDASPKKAALVLVGLVVGKKLTAMTEADLAADGPARREMFKTLRVGKS